MTDTIFRNQIAYLFDKSEFYKRKLTEAGFANAAAVGGLNDIDRIPVTEKHELRERSTDDNPIGAHLAASMEDIVRIYSTSGTTGSPSYIPLTNSDLNNWISISCRSYGASGIKAGERIITTYGAGPFVAGVTLDAFAALNLCHIPVGAGNTDRLLQAVQLLAAEIIAMTPSYALHIAEAAEAKGIDIRTSAVQNILVAGEPGGGEPALRARLEAAWGAKVTEVMGIGDISVSLWGECGFQTGMHFSGDGIIHFELIDPENGAQIPAEDGAEGELVYTHLVHRAAPLLRFRSRDHVRVFSGPCPCGRAGPRIRCIGRTDDMLIVRGVNLFPTAIREIVNEFEPDVTGVISIKPLTKGVKQHPPLPLFIELAENTGRDIDELANTIKGRIRETLLVTTEINLVPAGTLPRSDYKSKLVDWSDALDSPGPG